MGAALTFSTLQQRLWDHPIPQWSSTLTCTGKFSLWPLTPLQSLNSLLWNLFYSLIPIVAPIMPCIGVFHKLFQHYSLNSISFKVDWLFCFSNPKLQHSESQTQCKPKSKSESKTSQQVGVGHFRIDSSRSKKQTGKMQTWGFSSLEIGVLSTGHESQVYTWLDRRQIVKPGSEMIYLQRLVVRTEELCDKWKTFHPFQYLGVFFCAHFQIGFDALLGVPHSLS